MSKHPTRIESAWAIDTRSGGYIGRYWHFNGVSGPAPQHEGCPVALFTRRAIAREVLPAVRRTFAKAREVRVRVTVEPA